MNIQIRIRFLFLGIFLIFIGSCTVQEYPFVDDTDIYISGLSAEYEQGSLIIERSRVSWENYKSYFEVKKM